MESTAFKDLLAEIASSDVDNSVTAPQQEITNEPEHTSPQTRFQNIQTPQSAQQPTTNMISSITSASDTRRNAIYSQAVVAKECNHAQHPVLAASNGALCIRCEVQKVLTDITCYHSYINARGGHQPLVYQEKDGDVHPKVKPANYSLIKRAVHGYTDHNGRERWRMFRRQWDIENRGPMSYLRAKTVVMNWKVDLEILKKQERDWNARHAALWTEQEWDNVPWKQYSAEHCLRQVLEVIGKTMYIDNDPVQTGMKRRLDRDVEEDGEDSSARQMEWRVQYQTGQAWTAERKVKRRKTGPLKFSEVVQVSGTHYVDEAGGKGVGAVPAGMSAVGMGTANPSVLSDVKPSGNGSTKRSGVKEIPLFDIPSRPSSCYKRKGRRYSKGLWGSPKGAVKAETSWHHDPEGYEKLQAEDGSGAMEIVGSATAGGAGGAGGAKAVAEQPSGNRNTFPSMGMKGGRAVRIARGGVFLQEPVERMDEVLHDEEARVPIAEEVATTTQMMQDVEEAWNNCSAGDFNWLFKAMVAMWR